MCRCKICHLFTILHYACIAFSSFCKFVNSFMHCNNNLNHIKNVTLYDKFNYNIKNVSSCNGKIILDAIINKCNSSRRFTAPYTVICMLTIG